MSEIDPVPAVGWHLQLEVDSDTVCVVLLGQDQATGEVLLDGEPRTSAPRGGLAVADLRERLEGQTHTVSARDKGHGRKPGRRRPYVHPPRWSIEEEILLLTERDSGDLIEQIAARHGRTTGAIRSRLAKLDFEMRALNAEGNGRGEGDG